jgi:plasmid stabilization system protein ParE
VSRKVVVEPDASSELLEAARWYEARRSGVGLAFLAAVDRAIEQVAAWPEIGALVPGVSAELRVRKMTFPRFPYYLAYLVTDDAIHVLAVAHERRRPAYWHARTEP